MYLGPGTPQSAETQRANATLTTNEWEQFFHHCVKDALENAHYNPGDIYNMDELPVRVQYLSRTGRRVYTRRGSNQVESKEILYSDRVCKCSRSTLGAGVAVG